MKRKGSEGKIWGEREVGKIKRSQGKRQGGTMCKEREVKKRNGTQGTQGKRGLEREVREMTWK